MSTMAQDMTSTLITRVAVLALGFITNVLLARLLGSHGLGQYALIMTTLNLLVLCTGLGLDASNVYHAGQQPWALDGLVANSVWMAAAGGAVALLLFVVLHDVVSRTVLQGVSSWQIALGLAVLPFVLLRGFLWGLLRGCNKILAWNWTTLLNGFLLLVLPLFLVGSLQWGVQGALAAQLASGVTLTVMLLVLIRSGRCSFWPLQPKLLQGSVAYGIKMQTSTLVNYINYSLNYYLLNLWLNPKDVGHYSVAIALLQPLTVIPTALQYVLFPRVSSASAEQSAAWMPVLIRQTLLVMLGLAALCWLITPPLILHLYGPEYAPAIRALHWLLPGSIFLSLDSITAGYNLGRGRPDLSLRATAAAAATMIVGAVVLIPRAGLVGAAAAASAAFTVLGLVEFVVYLRLSGNSGWASLVPQRHDLREIMRVVSSLVRREG